jgi:hypothetical protein
MRALEVESFQGAFSFIFRSAFVQVGTKSNYLIDLFNKNPMCPHRPMQTYLLGFKSSFYFALPLVEDVPQRFLFCLVDNLAPFPGFGFD